MRKSITNCELEISNFQVFFRLIIFLCVFCVFAGNSFAQTLEILANQINFGTTEVKRNALFEIRNRQSEIASRIAIPVLKDSNEIVRATAAFSVIYLPKDEAFSVLAPNLRDKSELVRRETAYALGKTQNPNAVSLLIQNFQNKKEKSVEVKNACVLALGEIGDVSAIDFLTQILKQKSKDDNDFLRRSAARSVGQIAQIIQIKNSYVVTPENFLPEKYKTFALAKYENLSAKFPEFQKAVPVLIQILQNQNESDDAKRETAFALGAIGDVSSLPILQNSLNAKDYYLSEICKESVIKLASVTATE